MMITWDEPKRLSNLDKHGLDFSDLTFDFFEGALVRAAKDGRYMAIGYLDGQLVIAVVFSPLGTEALSIISMRPANPKERDFL